MNSLKNFLSSERIPGSTARIIHRKVGCLFPISGEESNERKWAPLSWKRTILAVMAIKNRNDLFRDIIEFFS